MSDTTTGVKLLYGILFVCIFSAVWSLLTWDVYPFALRLMFVIGLFGFLALLVFLWFRFKKPVDQDEELSLLIDNLPPRPQQPPVIGKSSSDSDVKYRDTLKPIRPLLLTAAWLITVVICCYVAAVAPDTAIAIVIVIATLTVIISIVWYIWSRTYLIITNTRAVLSTITPFGNKSPNVLLKEAGKQEVTQNLLDRFLNTCSLTLDTPSDQDDMWNPLRWVRDPEEVRRAIGLPTIAELKAVRENRPKRKI